MATIASKTSVLISGAGPSGLVLALSLRKNGIPVRIIDKELGPRLGERGAGVSPRSLELHKILGTFPDIYGDGKPIAMRKEYGPLDNMNPVKITPITFGLEPTVGIPHPYPLFVGQNHHERILRAHLQKLGTAVEFGAELRSFTQSEQSVTVEIVQRTADGKEEVNKTNVSWLVGTDGAHSVVRKTLGLDFMGETKDSISMITGDFRLGGEPLQFWEQWGDPKTKITFLRPSSQDSNIASFIMAGNINPQEILASPEATIEEFYSISGRRDIPIESLVWASFYRPNIRMVKKPRVGRVFIAGDAAHCHSPTGGQGLNSSIQDSFNLGWKLSLVEKGYAKESLLDTYAEERLPVIAEMLDKTTELLKERTGEVASQPKHKAIREDMTQLGITYRGSSLVLEDGTEKPTIIGYNKESATSALAGDRAPEAPGLKDMAEPGSVTSVYDGLLSPSCHSVLVFQADTYSDDNMSTISQIIRRQPEDVVQCFLIHRADSQVLGSPSKFHKAFLDTERHAHNSYNVTEPCIVVIRPDGVIGARISKPSKLEQYFRNIFTNI